MIVLYILLGLLVIVLLAAAVMPKTFDVSADIVIEKPVSEVFNYVKHLKKKKLVYYFQSQD